MLFGERLALVREKKKVSQDELAKAIGTHAPIIGRYERNEIKPSIEVAAKIADELAVTVDYLLSGSNMVMDKKLMKRMEDIEALPTEEKDKVYYFIDMALSHHKARKAFAK